MHSVCLESVFLHLENVHQGGWQNETIPVPSLKITFCQHEGRYWDGLNYRYWCINWSTQLRFMTICRPITADMTNVQTFIPVYIRGSGSERQARKQAVTVARLTNQTIPKMGSLSWRKMATSTSQPRFQLLVLKGVDLSQHQVAGQS